MVEMIITIMFPDIFNKIIKHNSLYNSICEKRNIIVMHFLFLMSYSHNIMTAEVQFIII